MRYSRFFPPENIILNRSLKKKKKLLFLATITKSSDNVFKVAMTWIDSLEYERMMPFPWGAHQTTPIFLALCSPRIFAWVWSFSVGCGWRWHGLFPESHSLLQLCLGSASIAPSKSAAASMQVFTAGIARWHCWVTFLRMVLNTGAQSPSCSYYSIWLPETGLLLTLAGNFLLKALEDVVFQLQYFIKSVLEQANL